METKKTKTLVIILCLVVIAIILGVSLLKSNQTSVNGGITRSETIFQSDGSGE